MAKASKLKDKLKTELKAAVDKADLKTQKESLAHIVWVERKKISDAQDTLKTGAEKELRELLAVDERVLAQDDTIGPHGYVLQAVTRKEYDLDDIKTKGLFKEFERCKKAVESAEAQMSQFSDMKTAVPIEGSFKLAPITKLESEK